MINLNQIAIDNIKMLAEFDKENNYWFKKYLPLLWTLTYSSGLTIAVSRNHGKPKDIVVNVNVKLM